MQFTTRRNGNYLTGIDATDFGYKNLGGRLQRNQGPNDKPSHYVDIKITDDEALEFFKKEQVKISERQDYNNPDEMVKIVKFKAYPKTRFDTRTGKDEQVPKVVLRNPETGDVVQLDAEDFDEFDRSTVTNVSIRFHIFASEYHGMHYIPVIDELWADDEFGPSNDEDDYLAGQYGVKTAQEEEEVPFK